MSLNDRILTRHKSTPFAVMFAQKLNTAHDYRGTESDLASEEELLAQNQKMVEAKNRISLIPIFPL